MTYQGLASQNCREQAAAASGRAVDCRPLPLQLAFGGKRRRRWFSLSLLVFAASTATAGQVDYEKQVKPIFAARCTACHGVLKQEGGLRLDTGALARQGGDSGKIIAVGDSSSSALIERISASDPAERMPQEGEPLTSLQISTLRDWIDEGANSPADEKAERDPRDHWSFKPIVRPPVPTTMNVGWARNPIDSFIAANYERQGLSPQVEATRSELMRRLYLDLIGLPPSLEQIKEASADSGDGWYERLADRLLSSPQHGERWARHWMDIWRYSDWWGLGDQMRNSQPHIWHWRDWIVDSLNANVPYNEMIRSMLAADELYPNDLNQLRATGFLARNFFIFNRNTWMEETVEHVSKGLLGLTMNCAKCHDHKFDPIKQADYYRMRAFFEPYYVRMDSVPTDPDLNRDGIPRAFDGTPDAPTYLYVRGQETNPDKSVVITPGVPDILAFKPLAINPVQLPKEACQPERRPWVLECYCTTAKNDLAKKEKAVSELGKKVDEATKSVEELVKSPPADAKIRQSAEAAAADAAAELHAATLAAEQARLELVSVEERAAAMRASWAKTESAGDGSKEKDALASAAAEALKAERRAAVVKGIAAVADLELRLKKAEPAAKAALDLELKTARETLTKAEQAAAAPIAKDAHFTPLIGAKSSPTRFLSTLADDPTVNWSDHSTGRRKALAEWITDPKNPLAARVAANHIWNRHMGTPLAPNPFDLGRNAPPPTNPELLDWLAAELIDSGWDMKHLHRLIVNSATFRMSSDSTGREANVAKDPDNIYWWRRNTIRLESEVIRDSVLSLAGTLDSAVGGAPVPPANEDDSHRRSLYFFHSNNERNLFLTTFDLALVTECYRRNQSVVPQQALAMTNSKLVLDSSKLIAEKISKAIGVSSSDGDDVAFIRSAFMSLLGVSPGDVEVTVSQQAFDKWRHLPNATSESTRSNLVWSLLNHNDFVTLR
jgi:hypothetical protein